MSSVIYAGVPVTNGVGEAGVGEAGVGAGDIGGSSSVGGSRYRFRSRSDEEPNVQVHIFLPRVQLVPMEATKRVCIGAGLAFVGVSAVVASVVVCLDTSSLVSSFPVSSAINSIACGVLALGTAGSGLLALNSCRHFLFEQQFPQ